MEKIRFFKTVVLRTPSFGLEQLAKTPDILDAVRDNHQFLTALYVANPEMHSLCMSLLDGKILDAKKRIMVTDALTNYYLRMSTNPTPFGLFAKLGTLHWGNTGELKVHPSLGKANTRLDMTALQAVIDYFHRDSMFMRSFKYFPNNTIYSFDGRFRYIEKIDGRDKSVFNISAIECSSIVETIIDYAAFGKTVSEIILFLKSGDYSGYSEEELGAFLDEMISTQLLSAELQLNVTGEDSLGYISGLVLERTGREHPLLQEISLVLEKVAQRADMLIELTKELLTVFEKFGISVEEKFLIQTDLFQENINKELNSEIQADLKRAIQVLHYFEQPEYVPKLEAFKKAFYERYEDNEVPLMVALDTDAGIGFGNFTHRSDNILLDESVLLRAKSKTGSANPLFRNTKLLLANKFISALCKGDYSIELDLNDFSDIEPNINRMGKTFQVMFNMWGGEDGLINFHTAGHASAGSLIGRFGYGSNEIKELLSEIAECENRSYPGAMVAEIVHLPDARTGNLSFRPRTRAYEIPVINHSVATPDEQISLADLHLVLSSGRLVLLSKKHGCEIVPKLTSAHNYNRHTSPAYQLLSELQYQNMVPSISLNLGDLNYMSNFIPRVQCGRVVLSRAKWVFTPDEISFFYHTSDYSKPISDFRIKWRMPRFVHYINKNSEVFLDWDNPMLVSQFVNAIAKFKEITFFEFPIDPNDSLVVDAQGGPVINQFIAFAENLERKNPVMDHKTVKRLISDAGVPNKIFPGNDWLYLKVYCSVSYSDKILAQFISLELESLRKDDLVDKFFFLRYSDPLNHLRLRFKCKNSAAVTEVMGRISSLLNEYQQKDIVHKVSIDTYSREMQRYEQEHIVFCESVFEASSDFWLRYLSICQGASEYYLPIIFLSSLHHLLMGIGIDGAERMRTLADISKGYEHEFGVSDNKELQKLVNNSEKQHRKVLEDVLDGKSGNLFENPEYRAIARLQAMLQDRVSEIIGEYVINKEQLFKILPSLMHMHAIRAFKTRPRENELFAYSLLYAYYKKNSYKINV